MKTTKATLKKFARLGELKHKEGVINDKTKYVVRIDGDIEKDAELTVRDEQNKSNNEDEIFCLIGSFLNRLKVIDWALCTKEGIRLNHKTDKLLIIDKTRGRIAKELSKIYNVQERR